MTKTYIKPETKIYQVLSQYVMQVTSPGVSDEAPGEWGAKGFDFSFEEEDVPGTEE